MPHALVAAALLALCAPCQGPVKKERAVYAALTERRAALARALDGADREVRQQVAELLLDSGSGRAFEPPLRGLALVRGVAADDPFLFRGTLCAQCLPEVVDPEGANNQCRDLQLTVYLPPGGSLPAPVTFAVEVRNSAHEVVHRGEILRKTDEGALRRYQARYRVPGADLADGAYQLEVVAVLDGRGPRPDDPRLVRPFFVQRGYQARAEAVARQLSTVLDGENPPSGWQRALLLGAAAAVQRVYTGEPWAGRPRPVLELQRAERLLERWPTGGDLAKGLRGTVPLLFQVSEERAVRAAVEFPLPGPASERFLLLFLPGTPAYDPTGRRPLGPRSTDPRWILRRARQQPAVPGLVLAAIESTAGIPRPHETLPRIIDQLVAGLGVSPGRVLLAAEGTGATVAGLHVAALAPRLGGVVLVGGGSLTRAGLAALDGTAILGIPDFGTPGARALLRLRDLAAGRHGAVEVTGTVQVEEDRVLPWSLALDQALPRVMRFAKSVFR